MRTSEWIVRGRDEPAAELAPHIVSRVGTVMRNHCDRYDGVRVERGAVIFGGAHRSHLISVVVGAHARSDQLGVRVLASGNAAAKAAAAAMPIATLLVVIAAWKTQAPGGLLIGLVVGLLAGVVASFATFQAVAKLGIGASGDSGRTAAIAQDLRRELAAALATLELELQPAELDFRGLDEGAEDDSIAAWTRIFQSAVGALAG